ncbi:Acb2/Tad1 domain-containing protein [Alcaligenes aquatilis]
MNEGKELAEKVGAWMEKLQADSSLDQRAVALGKTNLQQGFMWAIRGIAQPTTF